MKRYPLLPMRGHPEGTHGFEQTVIALMMLRELGGALDALDEIDAEDAKLQPLNLPARGSAIQGMLQDRTYWSSRRLAGARSVVLALYEVGAAIEKIAANDPRAISADDAFKVSFPELNAVRNSIAHPHERATMPPPKAGGGDDQGQARSDTDQVSVWGVVVGRAFEVDRELSCLRTTVRELIVRIRVPSVPAGRTVHFRIDDSILEASLAALRLMASATDDPSQPLRNW